MTPDGRCCCRPSSQDQSANDATSTGASDNGNRSSSAYGVTSHTWDLPPEDKIMWKGLTLHNGGQTLYGSVWPQVCFLQQTTIGHFLGFSDSAGRLQNGSLVHHCKQAVNKWPGLAGGMRRLDVWVQERQKTADTLKWIFDQYHAGKISAWVDPKPFRGLDSVADAVDHMLSGESIGKVVVDLR